MTGLITAQAARIARIGDGTPAWLPMRCDHTGLICVRQVTRAPRIVVPSATPWLPGHRPFKVMTTLHYCDLHQWDFQPDSYWTDAQKARAEAAIRDGRPDGFKLDFERSWIEQMLVDTPEYMRFLHAVTHAVMSHG
jgi:hypothetical protein